MVSREWGIHGLRLPNPFPSRTKPDVTGARARLKCGAARLVGALGEDSCQVLFVADGDENPEYGNDNRHRKTGRGHERMEPDDVHDHWAEDAERERDVAVDEEQRAADDLAEKDDDPVVRGAEGCGEVGGRARGRLARDEVEETVETEYPEDDPEQVAGDSGCDFQVPSENARL
jgi:hypothetical protein